MTAPEEPTGPTEEPPPAQTYEEFYAAVLTGLQAAPYHVEAHPAEETCYRWRKGLRVMHQNGNPVDEAVAWLAGTLGVEPTVP